MLLGYKPAQHVTVLNTVSNCNTMVSIIILYYNIMWTAIAQWLRSLVRSQMVSLEFFIEIKSFGLHFGPWIDSASNRNESRSISWGKGGRCIRLTTLPPSCAIVMKSGNLNFLEPSGPLHACNGTALPYIYIYIYIYISATRKCRIYIEITWQNQKEWS